MATISKLVVSLEANSAKLVKTLESSRKRFQKWGKNIAAVGDFVAKSFKVITLGLTAMAAAGAAVVIFKSKEIDKINQMSSAFGITTKAMQEWSFAGKAVGLEGEKIGDIFKDVSDKLGDFINTGGGGAADLFEYMNIQISDFIGLAPDKAMLKLGEAMDGLNKQDKIFFLESIASDASLLLPLLEDSGKAFKQLAADANSAGAILSDDQIAGVVKFRRAMDGMSVLISGFAVSLTAELAPGMTLILEKTNEWIASIGGGRKAAQFMAKVFIRAIAGIIRGFGKVVSFLQTMEIKLLGLEQSLLNIASPIAIHIDGSQARKEFDQLEAQKAKLQSELDSGRGFQEFVEKAAQELEATINTDLKVAITDDNTAKTLDNLKNKGNAAAEAAANFARILKEVSGSKVWDDIFKKEEVTARSNQFDDVAKRLRNAIEGGSQFTADYLKQLTDIVAAANNRQQVFSNNGKFEQVDIKGMTEVLLALTRLADAKDGGNPLALAAEKLASSTAEQGVQFKQFLDKLNSTPQLANLELSFLTDTGKVAGEIFAEPEFVDKLKAFNQQQQQNGTRADSA